MVGLLGKGGMQRLAHGRLQLWQPSNVNEVKLSTHQILVPKQAQ